MIRFDGYFSRWVEATNYETMKNILKSWGPEVCQAKVMSLVVSPPFQPRFIILIDEIQPLTGFRVI